ncbi:MAG: hypothetical protein HLUCCX14_07765 [Marinobacter excellens HL-55]|uniref:Lipoprotein n=1 Tax=Marinobacter excellens HL-55 TaxID=1305731 RepID=A0A0P8D091_9GAMM|nr:MAG: hypothetical protein HLUCCX14_07765 [Marinobacter excellens HL-55]
MRHRLRTSGFSVPGVIATLLLSGCFGGSGGSSGNDRAEKNRPGQEAEQPPRLKAGYSGWSPVSRPPKR